MKSLRLIIFLLPILLYGQSDVEVEGSIKIGFEESNTPQLGTLRFNPNTNDLEGWNGFFWASLTGVQYLVGSVTDIDGNEYATVRISGKYWMAENLKVTHFRDNSEIPNLIDNVQWQHANYGAWCHYDNSDSLGAVYGHLYNWYAVDDSRGLCPDGWHVPDTSEWNDMYLQFGNAAEAGGHLRHAGTKYWEAPNEGATNSSGLTLLPASLRYPNGDYFGLHRFAHIWSSTSSTGSSALSYFLYNGNTQIYPLAYENEYGFSVRCIKD